MPKAGCQTLADASSVPAAGRRWLIVIYKTARTREWILTPTRSDDGLPNHRREGELSPTRERCAGGRPSPATPDSAGAFSFRSAMHRSNCRSSPAPFWNTHGGRVRLSGWSWASRLPKPPGTNDGPRSSSPGFLLRRGEPPISRPWAGRAADALRMPRLPPMKSSCGLRRQLFGLFGAGAASCMTSSNIQTW